MLISPRTLSIVGATGSGSPGSGPFTTIRRYEELKGPGGAGVHTRRRTRTRKIVFWSLLGGFSPGDPENRIRGAILRILVVGELRGMTFKLFYAKLRKNLLSPLLLAPTISKLMFGRTRWGQLRIGYSWE